MVLSQVLAVPSHHDSVGRLSCIRCTVSDQPPYPASAFRLSGNIAGCHHQGRFRLLPGLLGTLPLRTMQGPESLPYELLKISPQRFKEQILECINAILLKEAVPHGWAA